jgi:carbon storage regulator
MLVLTIREGSGVFIGDDVHVHVVESNGKQVRLGIVAPRSLVIRRDKHLLPLEVVTKRDRIRQLMGA